MSKKILVLCTLLIGAVLTTVLSKWPKNKVADLPASEEIIESSERESHLEPQEPKEVRVTAETKKALTNFLQNRETNIDHIGTIHWKRELRPFEVTHETESFQWTSEDAMEPQNMVLLASNGDNLEFFEEENQWANKRQLVYVKEGFSEKVQQVFDQKLKELTLPGFDGKEYQVKILNAEENDIPEAGPLTGDMIGEVVGWPGSRVYLSSWEDYWSIAIEDSTSQIQILNREHGEWILSDINYEQFNAHNADAGCGLQNEENPTGLATN